MIPMAKSKASIGDSIDKNAGECIVFCIDNSEWMRSEDYSPSRWDAQKEACQLLMMGREHEERNSVALIATAGKRANVELSLTEGPNHAFNHLQKIKIQEGSNYVQALQMAQMVLKNRSKKNQSSRIVWFAGSPLSVQSSTLLSLAKDLKKNNIAVDVVNFGEISEEKTALLKAFHDGVLKSNNCQFVGATPQQTFAMQVIPILCMTNANLTPYIVWQKAFGNNPAKKLPTREQIEAEAVEKAEALGMAVLPLPSSDKPQCRKTVLDRQRYKYITRQVTIPVSAVSLSMKDKRLVVVIPSPKATKRAIASFKCGRMNLEQGRVVPDKSKGEASLWMAADSSLELQWRDLMEGTKLEVSLDPKWMTFQKVAQCQTHNVYVLTIKRENSLILTHHFFWSQERESDISDEFCFLVNFHLKNYHPEPELPPFSQLELHGFEKAVLLDALDLQKYFKNKNVGNVFLSRGGPLEEIPELEVGEETEYTAFPQPPRLENAACWKPSKSVGSRYQPRVTSKPSEDKKTLALPSPVKPTDPSNRLQIKKAFFTKSEMSTSSPALLSSKSTGRSPIMQQYAEFLDSQSKKTVPPTTNNPSITNNSSITNNPSIPTSSQTSITTTSTSIATTMDTGNSEVALPTSTSSNPPPTTPQTPPATLVTAANIIDILKRFDNSGN